MPQISLYVDEDTMLELREHASRDGVSLSRFTLRAIREQLDGPRAFISDGYWESLYGCLADDESFARQPQPGQRKAPAPGSASSGHPQPQSEPRKAPAPDLN